MILQISIHEFRTFDSYSDLNGNHGNNQWIDSKFQECICISFHSKNLNHQCIQCNLWKS